MPNFLKSRAITRDEEWEEKKKEVEKKVKNANKKKLFNEFVMVDRQDTFLLLIYIKFL